MKYALAFLGYAVYCAVALYCGSVLMACALLLWSFCAYWTHRAMTLYPTGPMPARGIVVYIVPMVLTFIGGFVCLGFSIHPSLGWYVFGVLSGLVAAVAAFIYMGP